MSDKNLKIDDVEIRRYWSDFDKIPTEEERFKDCRVIRQDGINTWTGKEYKLLIKAEKGIFVTCLRTATTYIYREGYWFEMKPCLVNGCIKLAMDQTLLGKPICDFHSGVYF